VVGTAARDQLAVVARDIAEAAVVVDSMAVVAAVVVLDTVVAEQHTAAGA
jgi:hypothetical protein